MAEAELINVVLAYDRCCGSTYKMIKDACCSIKGVYSVTRELNSNKVHVSGIFDPVNLRDEVQRLMKETKVELMPPKPIVKTLELKFRRNLESCANKIHTTIFNYTGVLCVHTDKTTKIIKVKTIADPKRLIKHLNETLNTSVQILSEEEEASKENNLTEEMEYFMVGSGCGCRKVSDRDSFYLPNLSYPPQMFNDGNPNSCSVL